MSWLSNLWEEYKNHNLFFSEQHLKNRQLVFYSEGEIYYQTFRPFIEELLKFPGLTCSYITSDIKDPILRESPPGLYPFYFNYFLKSVFDKMDARCFVFTMPDLNTYHLKKSPRTKEYVYLFHAFSSTHLQYNEKAFDAYDTVFCVGPHHIAEIQKQEELYHLPKKQVLPIGYPRMDSFFERYQVHTSKPFEKPRILVAPTWSMASLLENGIEAIIDVLAKEPIDVTIRPHPEFLKRRSKLAKYLEQKVSSLVNFSWETDFLSEESLLDADILITDRSGIAFEYAFGKERPVIFIETPFKEHNPQWKALGLEPIEIALRKQVGHELKLSELDALPRLIQDMLRDIDSWKERLKVLREANVFNWSHSAQAGVNYLAKALGVV
jgi:YidC/Oxa1 family membrane protein insertase